MNQDNVLIVILLVIGIVVLSNVVMFAAVRGSRGLHFDWLKNIRTSFRQPFKTGDDAMDELHQRVSGLKKPEKKE